MPALPVGVYTTPAGKWGYKPPTPSAPQTLTPAQRALAQRVVNNITHNKLVNTNGRVPGQGAPGKSSSGGSWLDKYLASAHGSTGSSWDPLAGMPQETALTAFPTLDPSTLPDGSDVPNAPAHQFTPGKAQLLDPNAFANLVGAKSYKPLIDALSGQQSRIGSGVADANAMLDKSFGDAANSSYAGAQVVKDSNAQANQSLTDLAARMAQAAGGDPTAAAAVGQASANQQSADSRMAGVAEQAQADQAAAAQRDLGTAKLAYKSSTDKAIADLATTLGQTQAAGSQAQGKALEEALGFNSSQQTAQQGRDTAKQEAWLAGQLAGPQITAGKLANEGTRGSLMLRNHQQAVNDWTALNSSKQTQYTNAVTRWTNKNVANQMKDALMQGKRPGAEVALADPNAYRSALSDWLSQNTIKGAGPAANPATLMSTTVDQLKTEFPDSNNLAIKALAYRFVQGQLNAWNAYHPKARYASTNGAFKPAK